MMSGPGDEIAAAEGRGRGELRASHADREQTIEMLKAAFVQERLAKGEFDLRVGQAFAARTYAELASLPLLISIDSAEGLTRPAIDQALQWQKTKRQRGLSVRSRVAFFHGQAAQPPFDDGPEPGAFHRLAGRALTAVLECGAGHLDTVLLLGQLGQLVIDHLPLTLPLALDETPDLGQRESDLTEEEDHTDVPDRRRSITASSRRPGRRPHQPKFVVVPQRGRWHAGTFGQLAD